MTVPASAARLEKTLMDTDGNLGAKIILTKKIAVRSESDAQFDVVVACVAQASHKGTVVSRV